MNASAPAVAWIAKTSAGDVVIGRVTDAQDQVLVDRPALGRFRETVPLELRDEHPVVDQTPMDRVAGLPSTMDALCGWYEGDGRMILLTQFPEPYWGEPLLLVGEGDRVTRAYPINDTRLLAEDGTFIELDAGRIRLTTDDVTIALTRSERYRETIVEFADGDLPLAGTVIAPAGPGPHPAAVVLHGAAGGQRDFCRLFIGPLLEAGVAVLIYDKAGHGLSGGAGDPTIFEQASAAEAGLDLLASRPDIDVRRIGLVGFSNGMWAAPMVAARRPDVAFVVGIGSPGVSMAESEVHRRTKVLRDAGVGEATLAAVAEAWRCMFAIVDAGCATGEVSDRLDRALRHIESADDLSGYEVPDYVRENPMLSPIPPLIPVVDLVSMISGLQDPQVAYDPAVDYAAVRCPVLLQYGLEDTSVPVQASVRQIKRAIARAGQRSTIHVYPGLEHMLNVLPELTGLSPEGVMYGFHQFRFGAQVRRDLADWLCETV